MKNRLYFLLFSPTLFSCTGIRKPLNNLPSNAISHTEFSKNFTIETHTFGNNLAHFSRENVSLNNNQVVLSVTAKGINNRQYSGAEIRSKQFFLYGTFNATIKTTEALGCITAFFLYKPKSKKNTEIDFEISGKYPNLVTLNHWVDKNSNGKDMELPFNTSNAYHNYTIIWLPNKITWLIDRAVIYSTTKAVPNKAMQIVFNLWVTNSVTWAGQIQDHKLPTYAYLKSVSFNPYKIK